MKILFIEDVPGTAYAGDIKDVKSGFARNYLLPRKLAVLATADQMNRVNRLRSAASKRRDATEAEMKTISDSLEGVVITIEARSGRNNRLYGSITNAAVAEELGKLTGREIDRRKIIMDPIRQLGTYQIPIKLHQGVEPMVTVAVVSPGSQDEEAEPEPTVEEVVAAIEAGEEPAEAADEPEQAGVIAESVAGSDEAETETEPSPDEPAPTDEKAPDDPSPIPT
ncbi:MAG: 50S ribosomal protein L9 [Chloroflexi bacterium]|nr:50S ribosomal protein L9 [Chloroflexota bacterium]